MLLLRKLVPPRFPRVPRARSASSVATKLGGALREPLVAEPHRAMANPLGMDACKICGLDVQHACAICRQGIDVVLECVDPQWVEPEREGILPQWVGFELEALLAEPPTQNM